ncbi:MAG: tetratricopeptide repeat protein [Desulfomonilaceae bacterium]
MMQQLKLNIEDEENVVESRLILSKPLRNHPLARVIKEDPECLFHHGNCFYYGQPFGKDSTLLEIVLILEPTRVVGGHRLTPKRWYASKFGFQQNFGAALYWYLPSANRGCVDAQYILAEMYLHGYGLPKNPTKALTWFDKAAANGHPLAQYRLAYVYDNRGQVREDKSEVVELYRLEAEKGNADAQYELGMIHVRGEWVQKNYTLARHWLRKAAAQKHGLACYELGLIYFLGLDVKKNPTKALKCFRKAVELGALFAFFIIRKIESDFPELKTKNKLCTALK